MALNWNAAFVAAVTGGACMAILGAWMATRRPRRPQTLAVAAYAGLLGFAHFLFWGLLVVAPALGPGDVPLLWALSIVMTVTDVGSGAAMVVLALLHARPIRRHRWTLLVPGVLSSFLALGLILYYLSLPAGRPRLAWGTLAPAAYDLVNLYSFAAFVPTLWFALLAICFILQRRNAAATSDAKDLVAIAAATSIFLFWRVGAFLHLLALDDLRSFRTLGVNLPSTGYTELALLALALALWGRFTVRTYRVGSTAASSRRAAWTLLLLWLSLLVLGQATLAFWGGSGPATEAALLTGLSLFLSALALAYAVLRHQVFGLDVRVRWTLSKSTVAAVFIAVFFVASEATQQLFGGASGGPYVGILAAGALVFAFAPLSRLADRLAAKAIPMTAGAASDGPAREAAFRASVRLALRGGISPAEELELARIAEAHGISGTRSVELRHEVERQSRHARRRGPPGRRDAADPQNHEGGRD